MKVGDLVQHKLWDCDEGMGPYGIIIKFIWPKKQDEGMGLEVLTHYGTAYWPMSGCRVVSSGDVFED